MPGCTIGSRCIGLQAVSWARSGVRMRRCTICCRRLGLEAGSEGVLGSKWVRMLRCIILPVSWARSAVRILNILFVAFVLASKRGPNAKMYDLLLVSWARSGVRMLIRFVAGVLGSKRGANASKYDLLPVSWARSGVRVLRCTICCRFCGLEAGSEC